MSDDNQRKVHQQSMSMDEALSISREQEIKDAAKYRDTIWEVWTVDVGENLSNTHLKDFIWRGFSHDIGESKVVKAFNDRMKAQSVVLYNYTKGVFVTGMFTEHDDQMLGNIQKK